MVAEPPRHGGDLAAAIATYDGRRGDWLDLSTGINPHAYPIPALPPEAWTHLPQGDAEAALRGAAAGCYGVPDPACIVPAPGTQALIQWLARLTAPGTVAVVGPTYGEHAAQWRLAGHTVREVAEAGDHAQAAVLIVVNPNNPDGRIVPRRDLLAIADRRAAHGRLTIVDEAFADVAPHASIADAAGLPGLVILRSFGKVFGLAGLRLGFALASPVPAQRLREALGPWPVSGPALAIGALALADTGWIAAMRTQLATEAAQLDAVLAAAGLTVVGGTPLFRLIATAEAPAIYARLARRHILTRPFDYRPDWLRLGLPGDTGRLGRLAEGLGS